MKDRIKFLIEKYSDLRKMAEKSKVNNPHSVYNYARLDMCNEIISDLKETLTNK